MLGAIGGTGRLIVSRAAERSDNVIILIRSLEKAKDFRDAREIIGDVSDGTNGSVE
ncbi:hypothetical protein [Mesorhizobium sp. RMAD-H1]|uniref:NAD(P)H-binding protein n=1 Tax=Mesorhizobium sp. RMAD-H1 TaxID=2587065 RepID=UPI001621087D|nr:hypothetical protein [Mesorhizobium sp. RMAD-H1]MBB2974225.1 putative NADH-flavin reductase [Mesorhizobium sp. RMAD-H1]